MKKTENNIEESSEITPAAKVGERLMRKRKSKGWTRESMAGVVGMGAGSIESMETGRRMPGGEQVLILSQVFNISPNWILTGSEEFLPGQSVEGEANPAEMTKLFVALTQLDQSRQRMLSQLIIDLARSEVPADQLPFFESVMNAKNLIPDGLVDAVDDIVDDEMVGDFENQLGLSLEKK